MTARAKQGSPPQVGRSENGATAPVPSARVLSDPSYRSPPPAVPNRSSGLANRRFALKYSCGSKPSAESCSEVGCKAWLVACALLIQSCATPPCRELLPRAGLYEWRIGSPDGRVVAADRVRVVRSPNEAALVFLRGPEGSPQTCGFMLGPARCAEVLGARHWADLFEATSRGLVLADASGGDAVQVPASASVGLTWTISTNGDCAVSGTVSAVDKSKVAVEIREKCGASPERLRAVDEWFLDGQFTRRNPDGSRTDFVRLNR